MMLDRRRFLSGGAAVLLSALGLPQVARADSPATAALDKSQLIYLSPVLTDGRESTCHGEVWFVHHEGEIYVCTQADAWRAQALQRGLTRAKVWIGEFGVWTRAGDRYRSAPYLELDGRLETDATVHAAVLAVFGSKYAAEWGSWGPRFRDGLAEGSRVLLRYRPIV